MITISCLWPSDPLPPPDWSSALTRASDWLLPPPSGCEVGAGRVTIMHLGLEVVRVTPQRNREEVGNHLFVRFPEYAYCLLRVQTFQS